jgi:hypothetical protein
VGLVPSLTRVEYLVPESARKDASASSEAGGDLAVGTFFAIEEPSRTVGVEKAE